MLSASGWPESRISRPLWCSAMPPCGKWWKRKMCIRDRYRVTISYDSSKYYLYGLLKVEGIG